MLDSRMNHAAENWRSVTERAFVTFPQMLSVALRDRASSSATPRASTVAVARAAKRGSKFQIPSTKFQGSSKLQISNSKLPLARLIRCRLATAHQARRKE